MVYPENFESRIGFDVIREQCRALCTMRRSCELLAAETFSTSPRDIARRQGLADEMRRLLSASGSVLSDEYFDIDTLVDKIRIEGTFLDASEVARLGATLTAVATTVEWVRSREQGAYPYLVRMSEGVESLHHIVVEVNRIIDDHGLVRDGASPELAAVRREIRSHEGQVSKRLQAVLQGAKSAGIVEADATISIRDGRAVIPVTASNKRKLQGFIHDESATGKTFYVEPVEVVELNNRLRELEYAERREVVRVLTAFTDMVRGDADSIARSGEYIAQIDMIRAKARWALDNEAVMPIISTTDKEFGDLALYSARHPLLAQTLRHSSREVVPLTARLDKTNRILVISGPNAGGKSVCLKTFGLIQYMFQCGFPITASENSELPIFSKLYIDIGDQQSIENDLSTYSSHLLNMKAMLGGADARSMVLIDEFGSGTEPVMGASIAEAILERLVASGCYGVITTHYSNIKYYASATDGVMNGAMMFDVQNIRPLFRLETGKPGSSFAIEIARKIGLPEDIISAARDKAGSEHVDIEKQLREIARDRRYWEQKRERIRQTDRKVEELEQDYRERLASIQEERRAILRDAKAKAKELMAEANRQIETTIKSIRESQAEREQTKLLRRSFNEFKENVEQEQSAPAGYDEHLEREMARLERRMERRNERKNSKKDKEPTVAEQPAVKRLPLEVGAKVRLVGQDGVGVVQSLRGKKAQIAFGQILTTVDAARLEVISSAEYKRATRPETPRTIISADISQRRLNFRSSIDIRGERVADALERVQALVDDALMVGVNTVTILHGKGTGALKEEVRRYLRALPEVESAVDDHPDRGGSGITIVTFGI
ncbi:MAG: Smr/MutS family protein [Alistipes sp.]|nr:Smr/MutS family protein [Alistipes sp.]